MQLKNLFKEHFIRETSLQWFLRYPVYLQALAYRLERIELNPAFDQENLKQLIPLRALALTEMQRWELEELRVALFASHLKPLPGITLKRVKQKFTPH